MNNKKITLSAIDTQLTPVIHAVQYDTAREIDCYFDDIDVSEVTAARIYALKPDGTDVYNDCVVTSDYITAPLNSQTLAVTGTVKCQLQLTIGDILTTFEFLVVVDKSLVDASAIPSSNDYQALEQALADVEDVYDYIDDNLDYFFEKTGLGKNLFNPNDPDIVVGKIFDNNGDLTVNNANFMTSGYIEVTVGKKYVMSCERSGVRSNVLRSYCAYDIDKNVVAASGVAQSGGAVTIPAGTKYIRVSTYSIAGGGSDWQFEQTDTTSTSYEPYHYTYHLNDYVEVDGVNSIEKITETSSTTINLFDASSVEGGVITDTGIVANASYNASDFIYLGNAGNLACSWLASNQHPRSMVFYDSGKETVVAYYTTSPSDTYPADTFGHIQDGNGRNCIIVPVPVGAVYVRVSVPIANNSDYMIYTLSANEYSRPASYVAYNSGYVTNTNLRLAEPNYIKSYFNGKKAVFLGDSITAGYSLPSTAKPFPAIVSSDLDMTFVNYGIGGSEIAQNPLGDNTYNPMCIRYANMDNDADLIVVAGGTNDWAHDHTPLGTMGDTSVDTFYGAMDTLCKGLLATYVGKTIVFMTPIKRWSNKTAGQEYYSANSQGFTLGDIADAIKEVCAFYGIPVIDMFTECSINPLIDDIYTNLIPDGSHPNWKGQIVMARRVTAGIQALCNSAYVI